ncbi:E3 SUMO-protein ligase ZBED1-like isoform X2 [Macrosteles quadrilineatus]|uniref:E3 SUMO-protein ligase ZBED1-like n=1 Tax=Macrosteles quadrilineatus TaxID=74068 RepID=UPI0023E2F5E2|nr:E3 SUMO-protein ligase ZBED1-like [Macrosteles quadrilineatus]XP_054290125.1 E3 SUMO-protein ligase ZBED1-like [Macrosteles quadrilineatus]XP_054290126.1 E3 SUMO-protein ligase ZBED1-like [Macrosteles quadrilineatus]XP_054290127.1 E3 SUMO-protein ligase ZBED1-like [Macrosteles quadrilineatus]XP_054290872.1 E3 SUMO-protein ligase ZBED1-like isoform X2 [Macrosteles quadrilineatus]
MAPKRTSIVWKFFNKNSNDLAMCILCKKEIRHNSSTTNLRDHLHRKHPECLSLKLQDDGTEIVVINPNASVNASMGSIDVAGETSGGEQQVIYKMPEEKQVFNYNKLVVPMSMRSVYWKCFGFPANADGEVLTKSKIICLLCKSVISYNRNTSNLRMHLQNKHQADLMQLEHSQSPKKPRETKDRRQKKVVGNVFMTDMNGTLVIGGESNENANSSIMEDYHAANSLGNEGGSSQQIHRSGKQVTLVVPGGETQSCTIESLHPFMIPVDSKSVCDAIAEFVVTDLQLPEIVEGRGFQRLIATLKSPCEIPSKSKLMDEVIPTNYDKYKETLQETLLNLKTDVALTVEEWDSAIGESYITFSVCYQQENEQNLVSRVLSTVRCPVTCDIDFWNLIVDNMLEEWNVKEEKVRAVVCNGSRSQITDTFTAKGFTVLPCLMSTLQDVCSKVCFEQDDVREILTKCRAYIGTVYKYNNALAALRIQDHLMSLEETPLLCDYPKVWISTYQMLENFIARRQVLSSILDNIESATLDREAITLSEGDWALMADVVEVLEPFKVTAMTLSEEKAPLVSLIKPLLSQLLNSHLKEKADDSMNAQVFKGALKTFLSEKYQEPAVDQLLQIATTMDPRFKSLPNTTEESRNLLGGPIKEALASLIENTPQEIKPAEDSPPEKKKSRLSGMMMLLGEVNTSSGSCSEMTAVDRASLEIIQYQSEQTASLDQCPVVWWGRVAAKCPWLARLSHHYMCIPATALPPARLTMEAQVTYDVRRGNLTPEIIDRLIFLNSSSH